MTVDPPILEVCALHKSFGSKRVLENISFEIRSGEKWLVLGPNGVGKSTLLRILASLLLPDQGDIFWRGSPLLSDLKKFRSAMGWAPSSELGFHLRLSGMANLKIACSLSGHGRVHLDDTVEVFSRFPSFQSVLSTPMQACSAGMRKVLHLAISMLGDPPLLIWDEPTAHLDAVAKEILISLVQTVWADKTILFATHESLLFELPKVKELRLKKNERKELD